MKAGLISPRSLIGVLLLSLLLGACVPAAMTAAGVGGGAVTGHHLGGMAYRTFTEPLPRVRAAVQAALKRMAIKPGTLEKSDLGEKIMTSAGERTIEIELESITPNTTRLKVVVRINGGLGVVVDSATAVEIITQTEQTLGRK